MIKKNALWLSLLIVCFPVVYASGLLKQVKPDDLGELNRGRYKLISVIAGCEMDNKCVQIALAEIIKNDPHPVYENYLSDLNQHKDQIEYEQTHCNVPAMQAYRKEISSCLIQMLKEVDPAVGMDFAQTQKVQAKLNQCINDKIENIAKAGNIFAQAALMNDALKKKDVETFNRWYDRIEQKNTTLEYATHKEECQSPLQLFEWLP